MIPTLILAAGASSRMQGRDKLLEPIKGKPILTVLARRALAIGPTYITLPAPDHPRCGAVPLDAKMVFVDQTRGMAHSLQCGICALPNDVTGVIILPADMPDITQHDLQTIKDAALKSNAPIIRAQTDDGRAGHPVFFAASQFERFATLTGDRGAARLTQGQNDQTLFVRLKGDRARLDLDTPQDWATYHARHDH